MDETLGRQPRPPGKLRAVVIGRAAGESLLIDGGALVVLVEAVGPQDADPQVVVLRVDSPGRASRRFHAWAGRPADLGGGVCVQVLHVRAGKAALRVNAPGLTVIRKELVSAAC